MTACGDSTSPVFCYSSAAFRLVDCESPHRDTQVSTFEVSGCRMSSVLSSDTCQDHGTVISFPGREANVRGHNDSDLGESDTGLEPLKSRHLILATA